MGNAGIGKFLAFCNKTASRIKAERMGLRIEHDFRLATRTRCIQQPVEQGRTDTPTPPGMKHGHAPEVAIRQQSPRADSVTFAILRQQVQGSGVPFIPLQHLRYTLFRDKDLLAHMPQQLGIGCPGGTPQDERRLGHR